MKRIRRYHQINEESFAQVKNLFSLHLRTSQIREILKMSASTICAIKRNKDFAAYKAEQKAYFDGKKAKRMSKLPEAKPVKQEKTSDTPLYDVLVEIRDGIADLNRMIALSGKSKGFRLF